MSYNKEQRNIPADFLQRYVDDNFPQRSFLGGPEHRIPNADMLQLNQEDLLYPTPVLEEPTYSEPTNKTKPVNWI